MRICYTLLLVGCLESVGSEHVVVDPQDDLPDGMGERWTAEQIAADEAAARELPIARTVAGDYAWEATDVHAARINPHREGHGETPVVRSACLDAIARRWSLRMASGNCGDDVICHRPDAGPSSLSTQVERCWRWWELGENVAVADSEASTWTGLLGSPPHHENIDGAWNAGGSGRFGIGVFARSDGRVFVTQLFAQR